MKFQQRENFANITADWTIESWKKVIFSGKVLGFDREYELVVQTRDDVDSTAWFSQTTLATEQTDDLAKAMISTLLRFDQ